MTYELKDWLNSVNFTKEDLSEDVSSYPPYIINRCLSGHIDCVMYANEMNMHHHLDKDMQYSFYLNTLRKRKRFSPWLRKDKVKDLDLNWCASSPTTTLNLEKYLRGSL